MNQLAVKSAMALTLIASLSNAGEIEPATEARSIVEGYYSLWNQQQITGLDKFIASDVQFKDYAYNVSLDSRAGLEEFMQSTFAVSEELNFKILTFVENPPYAVTEWQLQAVDAASGQAYSTNGASVIKIVDGKITENNDYYNAE